MADGVKTLKELHAADWFVTTQELIFTKMSWARCKQLRSVVIEQFIEWLGDDEMTEEAETQALVFSIMPMAAHVIRRVMYSKGIFDIEDAIMQIMLLLISEANTKDGVRYMNDSAIMQRVKWRTLNIMRAQARNAVDFTALDALRHERAEGADVVAFEETLADEHDDYADVIYGTRDEQEKHFRRMVLLRVKQLGLDPIVGKIIKGIMDGKQKQEIAQELGFPREDFSRKYASDVERVVWPFVRHTSTVR